MVELMVVLTIMAILALIAYPQFNYQFATAEANTVKRNLIMMVKEAKVSSYAYRSQVYLCLLNEGGECDKDGDTRIVVFYDNNDDKKFDSSIDELIESKALNLNYGGLSLNSANRQYIRFAYDTGMPRGHFGNIKYCSEDGSYDEVSFKLSFSQTGKVTINPDAGCSI